MKDWLKNYPSNHRNNVNRVLHVVGIPLVLFGIFQICTAEWKIGLLNFFLGYISQYAGHAYFEKNQVGEWVLIKKIIKKLR